MLKHFSPTEQAVLGEWGHFFYSAGCEKKIQTRLLHVEASSRKVRFSLLCSRYGMTFFFFVHILVFSTFSNNLETNHCS